MKKQTIMRVVRIVSIILIIVVVVLTIVLLSKKRRDMITIGTGGTKGMYYNYSQKLAEIESKDLDIRVKETEGSLANLRLIQQGYLDVAIVQSDVLYNAKDEGGERNFGAVTFLYIETVQVVVRKDSGIESIADLKGKKVGIGKEESAIPKNVEDFLSVYGMDMSDIVAESLSFEESSNALSAGTIDAFFCTAGAPTTAISELAEKTDIKLLTFDSDDLSRISKLNKGYDVTTIPAGTYKGQDSEVSTIGVYAVLLASDRLDEDVVYKITKDIYDHSAELNEHISTSNGIELDKEKENVVIPFHEGASKYYREQGVNVDGAGGNTDDGADDAGGASDDGADDDGNE